ncbi:MAG: hypothetical protein OXH04_03220 [Acidobacteria bacterium]|nr:hypothetical protein [Acidobacteriota bacterium]
MQQTALVGLLILASAAFAIAQTAEAPRTPWGAPDLGGYWEYRSTTPLERPAELAGRERLTPDEEAAYLVERHAAIGRERDLQLNADWWQPGGLTDGRTALIVDPPDGRLPARTPAGRDRVRTLDVGFRARTADGPEDRERYERCIMGRTVPLMAVSPNRLAQIFQTPDYVAILHEQNSDLRIIPLDGRNRPAGVVRQWQGTSRGRWEGDTLVVETVGFNGKWTLRGAGPDVRYVERFRRAGERALEYEFTAYDAESFAAPWTVAFPITRATGPLFENACHEGNYSMPLILRGARAQERERQGQGP